MSTIEIEAKIAEMQELDKLAQEAKEAADTIRDEIKMVMGDRQEMTAGRFIVRWTSVLSNRLDTTAMKKDIPQVYQAFVRQTTSRRFSISA